MIVYLCDVIQPNVRATKFAFSVKLTVNNAVNQEIEDFGSTCPNWNEVRA